MKIRKILICIIIFIILISTCNTDKRLVYASTHVHTDACYESVQYNYTGGIQSFTAKKAGTYRIKLWGAQGGNTPDGQGGLGGYSEGTLNLDQGKTVYIYVGKQGKSSTTQANGGEYTNVSSDGYTCGSYILAGGGGGAGLNGTNVTYTDVSVPQENITNVISADCYWHDDTMTSFTAKADGHCYLYFLACEHVCSGYINVYRGGTLVSQTPLATSNYCYTSTSFIDFKKGDTVVAIGRRPESSYYGDIYLCGWLNGTYYAYTDHIPSYSTCYNANGGNAGGLSGSNGGGSNFVSGYNGLGGTPSNYYLYGMGQAPGGGYGYYSGFASTGGGAGGGASYIGGVSNGITKSGVNSGNGKAIISYETPICAAATIAPVISLNNMTSSTVLSESNTSFCPQIKVFDNENDSLSCKYYLDGSSTAAGTVTAAQSNPGTAVTFPNSINAQNLYEGTHTIKVTAEDGMAPMGASSLTFKVDKSAPIVNSISATNTVSSIKLDVSASDAIAGLASSAYRYTIGGVATDWLTTPSYTKSGLASSTNYSYTIEVRDSVGHITTRTGSTTTKVGVSQITASALNGGGVQTVIKDTNPDGTMYLIKVGSQYAKQDGTLSTAENWITLSYDASVSGKKLVLSGLSSNTSYIITASAKNTTSGEIVAGGNVAVKTAPAIPTNLVVSDVSQARIQLNWNMDDGAVSYNLSRQSVTADGTVTFTKFISDIVTNNYSDTDLSPNQIYRYRIQGKNQYGTCSDWSTTPISTKSLPQLPPKITDIVSKPDGSSLDISWPSIAGAVGYELEVSYGGVPLTNKIVDNKFHFDKGQYDNQCSIRVRAYNVCDVSNPADSSHWSNVGEWSTPIISYTDADKPALEQIVAEQVTNNSVVIKWDKNNNPPSVQYVLGIYCNGVLKEERTVAGTLSSDNKLTSTITGLLPETSYTFCLKAVNSTGKATDWSNEVNTMTRIDKPSLLTGLRATAKSNTINLFWNSSLRAQSYSIERNDQVIAENIEGTSYIDNNVTSETEYTYRVKAVNTTGESEWSPKLIKKTLGELPAAPSPSVTAATGSAISLVVEWAPQSGVTGYDVEADGNVHNVGMNPSYTDDGLTPGSTHTYRVRSRNIYGKSDWSSAVTMKLIKDVPTTPIGVSATASDADLLIHWNTVEEAETYDVEINSTVFSGITSADYLYHLSGTAVSGSAITITNATAGEYIIRVRAVNQGGESDWSEAVTAGKIGAGGSIPILPIPEVPVLKSSVSGSTTISLTWDNTDNASVYQLESDGSILYTGSGAGYIHSGLTANSTHTYRIRSGNYSGYSNWSEPITATTNSVNTTTPQNLSYYRNADGSTAIIWDKVTGVLGYRVEVNGLMAENIIKTEQTLINTVPGMQYKVRIASIIPDGENTELDWSDEMDFRAPSNLPNVPIVDKVTATNDTIDITWSKADRALGYEVELDGKTTDAGNQLTYCIAGLKASSSYSIRVRAYNESGAGEWSKAKTIVTGQGIPGVPINIMVEAAQTSASVTGAAITVRWDTINGAESYETEAADGTIYKSNTNSVIIDNLTPGERYYFKVRAVTEAGKGAWSSRISYVPMLTTPTNLAIQAEGGGVHLTWDKAGIADSYEIEVDGIIYATTNATAYDFNKEIFSLKRTIRVRACWGTQKSEWSAVIQLSKPLSVTEAFAEGEEFTVLLPVKKAELSKYKLTLKYNTNELELLDACQATPKSETESIYIKQFKTHIIISEESGMTSITYLFDDGTSSWTGLAGSIRFRSKVNNTVTLQYGVAEK